MKSNSVAFRQQLSTRELGANKASTVRRGDIRVALAVYLPAADDLTAI